MKETMEKELASPGVRKVMRSHSRSAHGSKGSSAWSAGGAVPQKYSVKRVVDQLDQNEQKKMQQSMKRGDGGKRRRRRGEKKKKGGKEKVLVWGNSRTAGLLTVSTRKQNSRVNDGQSWM